MGQFILPALKVNEKKWIYRVAGFGSVLKSISRDTFPRRALGLLYEQMVIGATRCRILVREFNAKNLCSSQRVLVLPR